MQNYSNQKNYTTYNSEFKNQLQNIGKIKAKNNNINKPTCKRKNSIKFIFIFFL